MSKFTDQLNDYGLTLDELVIVHDRRTVDKAVALIDEMETVLRDLTELRCVWTDPHNDEIRQNAIKLLERLK